MKNEKLKMKNFFLSLREKSLKILNKILPLRGKY